MNDDLVKRLRDRAKREDDYYEHGGDVINEAADTIEKLIEIIQNHDFLESLIKPSWTPMTERTPKEELCFYLCYTDKGVIVECLWTNNRTGLGPLGEWGWRFMDVPSHQHITHWMPLPPAPEPPKEEREDADS